ncbi:MAG: P-loop NTPase, partial [Actinomycetes bacterium]
MSELNSRVIKTLSQVIDPELRKPITELGMVGEISETSSGISVVIKLTVSHCPAAEQIETNVSKVLVAEFGDAVQVIMQVMTTEELNALKSQLRGSAEPKSNPFTAGTSTRIFLFGSGKGGVGKSTITANAAVELASQGYEVGLIDADIFGFSIPGQLGLEAKPT